MAQLPPHHPRMLHTVKPRPWYRERWPWLLMAGPGIVVVACIITIYLAFTQDRDTPLVTQQNRQGLVVKRDGSVQQVRFLPPEHRSIPDHLKSQLPQD